MCIRDRCRRIHRSHRRHRQRRIPIAYDPVWPAGKHHPCKNDSCGLRCRGRGQKDGQTCNFAGNARLDHHFPRMLFAGIFHHKASISLQNLYKIYKKQEWDSTRRSLHNGAICYIIFIITAKKLCCFCVSITNFCSFLRIPMLLCMKL